ncbi:receiver/sensor box histidine kinase [Haloparvum sedimenti]|uniref:receiver/sensor box histidine kinase n=1 Tax=Haloparvum sedimenti TaxID=1678448 RepID=UPI00071E81D8|nr:PAS domain S-box protein [Haloparvum sedimenti]
MVSPSDPIRVLAVDDDGAFAGLTADSLEQESDRLVVETATDPDAALDRLRDGPIDCVVSDYDMPGRDGIELLEAARETNPRLPFVLFTSDGSEAVAAEAIRRGATDYLRKEAGASQYTVLANRIENAVTRYRAEREAEETHLRYRRLIEESTDVIVIVDRDGAFRYLSPTAERVLGYEAEELVGENAFEYVHEGDRDRTMETFYAMVGDPDRRPSAEFRFRSGDGTWTWLEARGRDLLDDPVVGGLVVYVREITDRKRHERALERVARRTGDLIEASSVGSTARIAVDIVDRALGSPLAGVHLLSEDGRRLERVAAVDEVREGVGVPEAYGVEDEATDSRVVWETFRAGESRYIPDTRTVGTLGEETPSRSAVVYPLGDHGVLVVSRVEPEAFEAVDRSFVEILGRTLTAALDAVDREAELRDRTDRLERLHETTRELMRAADADEVARLVVRAAEDVIGFPLAAVRFYDAERDALVLAAATDTAVETVDPREAFEPGESLNWRAYESGTAQVHGDVRERESDADPDPPLRSLMAVPLGEHGTVSVATTEQDSFAESDAFLGRLLATTAELTLSRLEHERELVRQRDELDRQNERLDGFASTLTHDLRNPLNVATGRLELAREECDSEHLDAVAREGMRIESTERVALASVVEACWVGVDTADATLRVETTREVRADESRLRQLLENLFRNAVDHVGPEVTVTVGDLLDGFYVADDGPGIDAADRDRVFEAGFSDESSGSGLGLHIVQQIAEGHGWSIEVTESDAGGARFEIQTEFGS